MANEKISAFSTILTIPGGPIAIKEVEGIAAYCDDPNNPGSKVNVSFSGSDIEDLYLQDLNSVLDQGNQSPNGGEIEMLDANGFNPLTLSQTGLTAAPSSNLTLTGSGFITLSTSGNNAGISLSTLGSTGSGNITIASRQSGGRLELESSGLLRFNFQTPTANQVLQTINTSGDVEWVDLPSASTPDLAAVLTAGNTASDSIDFTSSYGIIDRNASLGTGGQVLLSTGSALEWTSYGIEQVLQTSSSAGTGQSITFTDGTNINVLSVTGFDSASTATLEVKSSGASVEVNSVNNDVILKGGENLILENTGLGTPIAGDYLIADDATGKAKWYTDPKAFQTLSAGVSDTWAYRDGNNAVWAVGAGSVTLTITGASSGDSGTLVLVVSTGEVTWPSGSLWPDATAPTLSGNGTTVVSFIYDGSDYYWSYGQNFGA